MICSIAFSSRVAVACGSFSPPTYLHLRMFEMAKDEIVESQTFEIMGGYYSPVCVTSARRCLPADQCQFVQVQEGRASSCH